MAADGLQMKIASTAAWVLVMLYASWMAYDIRLYAIRVYGTVIHE